VHSLCWVNELAGKIRKIAVVAERLFTAHRQRDLGRRTSSPATNPYYRRRLSLAPVPTLHYIPESRRRVLPLAVTAAGKWSVYLR
jgi:hypothetical protein